MKRLRVLFILFAALFLSCSKEEITSRPYPRTKTLEITSIANGSAHFKVEVFFTSVAIVDHGFIWTDSGFPSLTNGLKKSFGSKSGTGTFEMTVDQLQAGKKYTLCAYAQSADYVVYGNYLEFTSK